MSFLFGNTQQQQSIPSWLEDAAKANIEKARLTGQVGYIPYYGPEVAALTPMQQGAMQNTMGAMSAFGMAPAGAQYKSSLPEPVTMGGVSGYSSGSLYDQALAEIQRRDPAQASRYMKAMGFNDNGSPVNQLNPAQFNQISDPRLEPSSPMYDPAYYNRVMAAGGYGGGNDGGGRGPQVSNNYWAQREAEVGPTRAFLEQSGRNQTINNTLSGAGLLSSIFGGGSGGGYSGPSNENSNANTNSSSVYGSGGFL